MSNRVMLAAMLVVLVLLTLTGCKSASKEAAAPQDFGEAYSDDVSLETGTVTSVSPEAPELIDNRKRIKKGDVSYRVKDLKEAERVLVKQVTEYGGFVDSSNFWGNSLTLVVKIPADNFDSFVTATESVGKQLTKSVSVEDVTDRFTDLDNRIKNRRILLERYQEYLRKAKDVTELLKLEREINDLTTEIEGLEGSFKSLKHQISYSRLEISLSTVSENIVTRNWPSLKRGFGNFGFALANFFYALLFIVIYGTCFGVPIILLLAALYWVSFGKLGLLRRLFSYLSPAKAKKEK